MLNRKIPITKITFVIRILTVPGRDPRTILSGLYTLIPIMKFSIVQFIMDLGSWQGWDPRLRIVNDMKILCNIGMRFSRVEFAEI